MKSLSYVSRRSVIGQHSSLKCSSVFSSPSQRFELLRAKSNSSTGSSPDPRQQKQKVPVYELLVLVEHTPDNRSPSNGAEEAEDKAPSEIMLDDLYSLQYMAPSVITAACGRLWLPTTSSPEPQALGSMNLAAHYRFPSAAAAKAFTKHPLLQQAVSSSKQHATILFEGAVENDISAVFRRSDDFGAGYDYIMLCNSTQAPAADTGNSSEDLAGRVLSQLGALATSSLSGGVQVSCGAVLSSTSAPDISGSSSSTAPTSSSSAQSASSSSSTGTSASVPGAFTHALMVRFPSKQQMLSFARAPPMEALRKQGERTPEGTDGAAPSIKLPLCIAAELSMVVEAVENQRQSRTAGM